MYLTNNEWWEELLRRQAAKGKWAFVWRVGLLGWGIPMVCAINFWFDRLTDYPRLTVLCISLIVWLVAGIILGLGCFSNARKSPEESRELWLQRRRKGEGHFVWRYGVLCFGVPMFVAFTTLGLGTPAVRHLGVKFIILNLAVMLLAGVVLGVTLWSGLERRYS